MDKTEKKLFYNDLHQKLGKTYGVSPSVIQKIRHLSIFVNLSQKEIQDQILRSINRRQGIINLLKSQIKAIEERNIENTELLAFLASKCDRDDFITITKKYL